MCEHCGAPITPYAHTDPVMGVLSRGFAAHKAVNEPKKLIVVVGMWLWIVPMFFFGVWFAVLGIGVVVEALVNRSAIGIAGLPLAFLGLVFMWMAPTMLFRTTRNYLRGRRQPADSDSDYASDNSGSEDLVKCLECGEAFPSDTDRCPSCGWSYSSTA